MSAPRFRVLALHFSQTGQLTRALESVLAPLAARDDVRVDRAVIRPLVPFRFPWRFLDFLDAFPESVHLDPPPVAVDGIDPDARYDLVILAWQVWFLAPSQPVAGFLASPVAARVLAGRPVVTLVGCRNMWTTAHRTMLDLLARAGARLVDNVVLTDSGPLWSTFITTPWWLLTGDKGPLLGGRLPEAGIAARDIAASARFGRALGDALPAIASGAPGPFLAGLDAVRVERRTMLAERIGHRSFRIWGRIVRAVGRPGGWARKPVLCVYVTFLVGAIVCLLPITMSLAALAARFSRRVDDAARALEAPSGAGHERMAQYATPADASDAPVTIRRMPVTATTVPETLDGR